MKSNSDTATVHRGERGDLREILAPGRAGRARQIPPLVKGGMGGFALAAL